MFTCGILNAQIYSRNSKFPLLNEIWLFALTFHIKEATVFVHKCWQFKMTVVLPKILLVCVFKLLTYLLTQWSIALLGKLTGSQLVKKFPAFYGTRRFITAFTTTRYLSLSWTSSTQSIPPHPTSWRSILILSSHLRLGLSSGLFPSDFTTKTLYTPLL